MSVCQNGFTHDYTVSDTLGCNDFSTPMDFTNDTSEMSYDPWHFGGGQFKVARRNKYLDRETPVYWPDTFVGGVFKCPLDEPCTNENAIPIAPLMADEPWHFLRKVSMWTITAKFPLLYSPDFTGHHNPHIKANNDWAQYIDINERYARPQRETVQHVPQPEFKPQTPKYAPERNTNEHPVPLPHETTPAGKQKYYVPGHQITVEISGFREGVKNKLGDKFNQISSQYSDALKQYSPSHGILGLLYHLRVNLEYSTAKRVWLDLLKLY